MRTPSGGRWPHGKSRNAVIDGRALGDSVPDTGGGKELNIEANSGEREAGGEREPRVKRLPGALWSRPSRDISGRQGRGPTCDGAGALAAEVSETRFTISSPSAPS